MEFISSFGSAEVAAYPAMLPSIIGCLWALVTLVVFGRVRHAFDVVEEPPATPNTHHSGAWAAPRLRLEMASD